MRSPVKENINNFRCLRLLKELIPKGSVVNSYLLFGGHEELSLAQADRFVIAHTTQYPIYEFWDCVMTDPELVAIIATDLFPKIRNVNMIGALQETWTSYGDAYARSALFFLLNKCSGTGLISSGELDDKNFNPLSLSSLKKFKVNNFQPVCDRNQEFHHSFKERKEGDYLLFPMGHFNYNLFEYGKSKGHETTTIYHKRFYKNLQGIRDKWVIVYKYHSEVQKLYKDHHIIMVDKYGRETKQKDACEDLVIANF